MTPTALFEPSFPHAVGLAAGVMVLLVGAFVLAAKPRSWLHRFFFLLALTDGLSTAFFRLLLMAEDRVLQAVLIGSYWYYYIAFVVLLVAFGVVFPKPIGSRRVTIALVGSVALAGAALVALYVLDPHAFWAWLPPGGAYPIGMRPVGNLVNVAFAAASGLLVLRLARAVETERSASHRRQAAYVLGGMALAYVPYPATHLMGALARDPARALLGDRIDVVLAYWAFALVFATFVGTGVRILLRPLHDGEHERRFVLACYTGVVAMAALVLAVPSSAFATMVSAAGLLAYPVLLATAIVRYEVFDIDRKLRRAATISLVALALTVVFIVGENAVETALQDRVFAGISSQSVAGSVAAIAAGALFVPVLKVSRRLSGRVIPELTMDEVRVRKLEIYRHSVQGAYADGILREGESRTLLALRESLGITQREHEAILAAVRPPDASPA